MILFPGVCRSRSESGKRFRHLCLRNIGHNFKAYCCLPSPSFLVKHGFQVRAGRVGAVWVEVSDRGGGLGIVFHSAAGKRNSYLHPTEENDFHAIVPSASRRGSRSRRFLLAKQGNGNKICAARGGCWSLSTGCVPTTTYPTPTATQIICLGAKSCALVSV